MNDTERHIVIDKFFNQLISKKLSTYDNCDTHLKNILNRTILCIEIVKLYSSILDGNNYDDLPLTLLEQINKADYNILNDYDGGIITIALGISYGIPCDIMTKLLKLLIMKGAKPYNKSYTESLEKYYNISL